MQDPREQLIDIAYGFFLPNALHTIAKLNIADQLSDGPKSAEDIAMNLNLHAASLHRVMRLLAKYEIFDLDAQNKFSLNHLSELLLSNTPDSVKDLMVFVHDIFNKSAIALDHTIKTGEPGCNKVFGKDFFSLLSEDHQLYKRFDKGMANYSQYEENILSESFEYGQYETIVDIGGGQGGLLSQILQKTPNVKGVLADQESVVNDPKYITNQNLSKRCEMVACDFFDTMSIKGDLYILKRIIHDWDDSKSLIILNNLANTMPENSRLLIMDSVINEDTPKFKYVEDVLLMTILDGQERTEDEFRSLIERSPFKINKIINTKAILNIIVCEKK